MPDTMSDIIQLTPTAENERAKVESWRLHVLIEAGYPLPLAERLAGSEADLHLAVDLVRAGCAAEVASEILL
jgi:uncharacterized protein YhjY with autotransporter beta-barrel domain